MNYFIIGLLSLVTIESIPFFYIIKYDKKNTFTSDVKVEFYTTINFSSILLFPFLYFIGLCILAIYLNDTFNYVYLTILFPLFLCIVFTYLTTKNNLKNYYFTNKGVELIDLTNMNSKIFPLNEIEFVGLKIASRYSSTFYISLNNKHQLKIDSSRISDKEKFKNYFSTAKIPYYEYDSFYGETKKFTK